MVQDSIINEWGRYNSSGTLLHLAGWSDRLEKRGQAALQPSSLPPLLLPESCPAGSIPVLQLMQLFTSL
jgi:hypothetical protein